MRKFVFRLEGVLKHRGIQEDLALQSFAVIQQEMLQCRQRLTDLHTDRDAAISGRSLHVQVEDVIRRETWIDVLQTRIQSEERILEGITVRLEDCRKALVKAKQDREAIERVKQTDLTNWIREAALAEQIILDEIGSRRKQQ